MASTSEEIRRICREFNLRVVFRSGCTLRSILTRVKDVLPQGKQSHIVYKIPCSCGEVYIGKTVRRLHTRLQEHQKACQEGSTALSAVAEHVYQHQHPIQWEETSIVDQARGHRELLVKEAIHIRSMPSQERFNRDIGTDLPSRWLTLLKARE